MPQATPQNRERTQRSGVGASGSDDQTPIAWISQAARPEVTRVAKEVGTEGKLGGHVNLMASNLTSQVCGMVTAVANGDLSRKFVVEAKGQIVALADTINNMTDTLRLFAEQVINMAREGRHRGQARRPRSLVHPRSFRLRAWLAVVVKTDACMNSHVGRGERALRRPRDHERGAVRQARPVAAITLEARFDQ